MKKENNFIKTKGKKILSISLSLVMAFGAFTTPVSAAERLIGYNNNIPGKLNMNLIGRYDVDINSPEGGLEIVAYNNKNQTAYAVDGINSVLVAIPFKSLQTGNFKDLSSVGFQIDLAKEVESKVSGFEYGDITSVAISPDGSKVAVAIQAKDYNKQGLVAIYPIDNSDDTLGEPKLVEVGVQPDMIVFAGNNTVITADEGEPRMGYGTNSAGVVVEDPKGSVSIVDINKMTAKIVYFDKFDSQKDALVKSGVLFTKGQAPSVDFEPEYIAVTSNGQKAYVSLQENNSLAVLDIINGTFTDVFALGFKDHSIAGNEIYLDGTPKTYKNLVGAYLPDGISIYENSGKTYILTANEGDAREWSSTVYPEGHEDAGDPNQEDTSFFINEKKITIVDNAGNEINKVVVLDSSVMEGLPEGKDVMFGGRSFSLFEVADKGVKSVFDSGSQFEDLTSSFYPEWFNSSHDKLKLNDRSTKKGPEPENVTIGKVGNNVYAFIAIERIGGIMAYDITDPSNVKYSNYINTRDFEAKNGIGGDSGPEGMAFVPASLSPTGKALLVSAFEITGTMPVYEFEVATETRNVSKDESKTNTASPTTEKPDSTNTYQVVKGDSLWKIAKKHLGDGNRYLEIFELNRDLLKSPTLIYPSQVLKMPTK